MRGFRALAVAAVVLLAGCSQDVPEAEPQEPVDDLGLKATRDTGVIRGVVFDQGIVPIPDVTVSIASEGLTTTTNADGVFGFAGLAPGTYFLEASRLGYASVQSSATVVAGEDRPESVRIQLTADPSQLPTFIPLVWDGYIVCGLSIVALCAAPVVDATVGDDFSVTFELDREGVDYLQSEMVWRTSQAVSPNLQLWQQASGSGGCTFEAQNGPSPNVINTTWGDYNTHGNRDCFATLGNSTNLYLRVFSGSIDGTFPPTDDGCYPLVITKLCTGVGATIEQSFTVFNHLFYGYKPPEGWQLSLHGEPPTPA